MRRKLLCLGITLALVFAGLPLLATPALASTVVTYPSRTLTSNGAVDAGHFDDVWDLTAGDMTLSFTYDANGLVDEYGGAAAHAWAELGIRDTTTVANFNPPSGKGVWLATDYDWTVGTFDPDVTPNLDLDDKLILQQVSGQGEGAYNLPSPPPVPGNNHRFWWDRDGVDPWQNGETANTGGIYNVVITLHATDLTNGTAYMTINGLAQGFETDGIWGTIELTPAGMNWTGDMKHLQVFYGLFGYGATHSVNFNNITVTGVLAPIRAYICLKDSNDYLLTPGTSRFQNPPTGSIAYFGQGTENGCLYHDFPAGTTNIKVWTTYNNTTSQQLTQDISDDPTFDFHTNLLTIRLETCADGTPLNGGNPRYGIGGTYGTWWFPGGATGSSAPGETAAEFFPGTYSFQMQYKATADAKISVVIPDNDTLVTWKTTKVTLLHSGSITYGGTDGVSTSFTKPSMELLPGTYAFRFSGYLTQLSISGCSMTKSVIILKLKDHAGIGLAGGTARGGYGTSYGTWFVPASTDANGLLLVVQDGLQTTMSYEMRFNNTTQVKTQDVSLNSVFDFHTNLLTLRLETCADSTPLDGGNPRYGIGGTYTTWWFPGGKTGSSAPGETTAEFFPGTYSFQMQYKATADAKLSVVIPDEDTLLTWQTTKVTLGYNGLISYGGATGDSTWFTKPSMELLPGTYKFNFRPDNRIDLTISGCSFTKSYVLLTVKDENGNGVPGGKATPAYGGSWGAMLPGATNASGKLFSEIPPGYTKINMVVNQGGVEQSLAQLTASNYTWITQILRIGLNDHNGSAITDGAATLDQGGGYWYAWGNLNALGYRDVQLFPATYKFRVTYNYTSQELFPVVIASAGIQTLYFQTGQVISSTITQYSASGWQTFTSGMELMPGTYTFKNPSQSGTVVAGVILNIP